MTTITKYIVTLFLCAIVGVMGAQEKEVKTTDSVISNSEKQSKIEKLLEKKDRIKADEREKLKAEVEKINKLLDDKEITASQAETLKKEAAKRHAANIEDRLAIIDRQIAVIKRNPFEVTEGSETSYIGFRVNEDGNSQIGFSIKTGKKRPPRYDIRTTNKMVFALGFNNAIADGQSLGDTPYKLGGSGFVELGWVWQTRLLKESNFARINYGFSFQWNKLDIKDDQYFVQNGEQTTLQDFPLDLRQAKFRVTNLVVPVHLEFGGSKKKDYGDRIRYFEDGKFKIGLGGYGGVRLGTMQKLRYDDVDNNRVKSKEKRNFNASNFVYGLSGYIGIGDWALYAKYDLNPLFKDQAIDQHNISLGLRWDLD